MDTMKNFSILGAIAGDTVGSIYEFRPTKDYNFDLKVAGMQPTDDSIMTMAVAQWLLRDPSRSHEYLVDVMRSFGARYPNPTGGYGGMFNVWLHAADPEPYYSWGNGSAMRVSPVAWACDTLPEVLRLAKVSAEVTHNHPEGILGAQATAGAVFLARTGKSKAQIKAWVEEFAGYDLDRDYDAIKATYSFEDSCQETVPQAIIAFLHSISYEDAIRLTVSLGGDADTMGAITGAIAGAFYGEMPASLGEFVLERLDGLQLKVCDKFTRRYGKPAARHQCGVTPHMVRSLKPNQVFVFGSNLAGMHGGGAARMAASHFGAKTGVGVGVTGQCYAIPTMQGGIDTIAPYVDQFLDHAAAHPEQHFLVTRIGCGIAGFKSADIAPLFGRALHMPNVSLPADFIAVLLH